MTARAASVAEALPRQQAGNARAPRRVDAQIRGIDVRRFRRLLQVSQEVLAAWLHVSTSTVGAWERAGLRPLKMNGGQHYFLRLAIEAAEDEEAPEEIGACLEAHDPDRAWLCVLETGRRDR